MQLALAHVDPWGDERADLRATVNTSQIVLSQAGETTKEQREKLYNFLQFYLRFNQSAKVILKPSQCRELFGE